MTLNNAKITILEQVIKWLTAGDIYEIIKKQVSAFMDADLTGDEKRARVQGLVQPILRTVAPFIVNLLIEVAVTTLKNQMEVKK